MNSCRSDIKVPVVDYNHNKLVLNIAVGPTMRVR